MYFFEIYNRAKTTLKTRHHFVVKKKLVFLVPHDNEFSHRKVLKAVSSFTSSPYEVTKKLSTEKLTNTVAVEFSRELV